MSKAVRSLSNLDKLFLYLETPETMMHVAGLLPFALPEGAPPDFLRELATEVRETRTVKPPWNLRLGLPGVLRSPVQRWVEDSRFDMDYHVRRSALPSPGDERELGVLISRLHSHPLDFHRPPWEAHLIEGLEGGRFALYVKVHHALMDGISSMRVLERSLSTDPAEHTPLFFTRPPPHERAGSELAAADLRAMLGLLRKEVGSLKSVGSALVDLANAARGKRAHLTAPWRAPSSILNGRVGRNRRFATQRYSLERLKQLAKASGGTLNDVLIALCSGGLRRFLLELGQLPEKPLVAFLPVNLRPKNDPEGGNAVGAILASMATDLADPKARLEEIIASTQRAKEQLQGMTPSSMLAYSALLMTPFGLQALQAMAGVRGRIPINFNVCISNVPGPEKPLYLRGARLEAAYPVSIATHGMALNITCQSYAGTVGFGFVGCRDTLPHLQNLAVYSGEALEELEGAFTPRRRSAQRG